jgi:carotenoid cleavage dioxygenase-like enzyme
MGVHPDRSSEPRKMSTRIESPLLVRRGRKHPFLSGPYRPVAREGVDVDLEIVGRIPADLNGTYYRNGPNPRFQPFGQYYMFDGDGMIHAVTFDNGRARHLNRWVRTIDLQAEIEAGRCLYDGMLDARAKGAAAHFKGTANTNLVHHGGKLLALMEADWPYELRPRDLATYGRYDFGGRLKTPMTAHWKSDPETGELLFFAHQPTPPYLTYHVADASGALVSSVEIEVPWPSRCHDFATTRDYVIFYLGPGASKQEDFARTGERNRWDPALGMRIGVMPRGDRSGKMRWFEAKTGWAYHTLNAYAEGDTLTLLAVRYGELPYPFKPQRAKDPHGYLYRWTLDLAAGTLKEETACDAVSEFPRVDPRRSGLPHRFGYLTAKAGRAEGAFLEGTLWLDSVVRIDERTGRTQSHQFKGKACGEVVVVPRRGGTAEDDAYLLLHVWDARTDSSELVILDAANVADEPIARVKLRKRVAPLFHGIWVDA